MKIFGKTKHIYFIGIGGIGMSGMAEFLLNHDFKISGSDINVSERVKHLTKIGIKVNKGHHKKNISDCDLIVYSSAININNNLEIKKGEKLNIPIIKRAELLGELIKIKAISIAISGTHGKTTTSSMLGNILLEAKLDPTLIIGGIVNKFDNNNISGSGDIIVVEADEFDKSFLLLNPTYAVINNLDLEHLDIYKDLNDLQNTFIKFANSTPFYGLTSICNDSNNLKLIRDNIRGQITTFGIKNKSDLMAKNIVFTKFKSNFKIFGKVISKSFDINLNIPGEHNIYNALAAISIALELNINKTHIINGLNKYKGVKRRFETKFYLKDKNILFIDDYAHHPKEIYETLSAIKNGWPNRRIITIFQPHLFSRTKNFYIEFAKALMLSNITVITEIYPAREKAIKGITGEIIANEMSSQNVLFEKDINIIPNKIQSIAKSNDIIITMGAGDIYKIIEKIYNVIKK